MQPVFRDRPPPTHSIQTISSSASFVESGVLEEGHIENMLESDSGGLDFDTPGP